MTIVPNLVLDFARGLLLIVKTASHNYVLYAAPCLIIDVLMTRPGGTTLVSTGVVSLWMPFACAISGSFAYSDKMLSFGRVRSSVTVSYLFPFFSCHPTVVGIDADTK